MKKATLLLFAVWLPISLGCISCNSEQGKMKRDVAAAIGVDVKKVFETDFIVGKTTKDDVRNELNTFKKRGADVYSAPNDGGTIFFVACRYDLGEVSYVLSFGWNLSGQIATKKMEVRGL